MKELCQTFIFPSSLRARMSKSGEDIVIYRPVFIGLEKIRRMAMRQNKDTILTRRSLYGIALALLLTFVLAGQARADVEGVTLQVNPNSGDGSRYNTGQTVTLTAAWTKGDTPPFAATFKAGGVPIGTVNTTGNSATFNVSGGSIGTPGQLKSVSFDVEIIETSVPNAQSAPGVGTPITIDLVPPNLAIQISDPSDKIVSKAPPKNLLKFIVNSDKKLAGTPETTIDGVLVPPKTVVGNVYLYEWTVPSTISNGQKTIKVFAKDDTKPESSANSKEVTETFTVDAEGPGAPPAITASDPPSPTSHKTFTLKGTKSADTAGVYVSESGSTASKAASLNGNNWEVTITTNEGERKFTAQGVDALGNTSPISGEFTVKIDTTGPGAATVGGKGTPTINPPISPTKLDRVTITGSGTFDPMFGTPVACNSLPVTVFLFDMSGTEKARTTANLDGTYSFADVSLPTPGTYRFYVRAEDSAIGSPGNPSNNSAMIEIIRDGAVNGITNLRIEGVNFATQSVPLPSSTWIGPGQYTVSITFDELMATDTNPTIGIKPLNGSSIDSNVGNWASPTVFVGNITIPAGQGAAVDGMAALTISKAKDIAGNEMTPPANFPNAMQIDTSAPVTTMASMSDILYIGSGTTSVVISGTASDAHSGVAFTDLVWQPFDGGTVASANIPIFDGNVAPFTYTWNTIPTTDGKYKLWAISADKTVPRRNIEILNVGNFRTMIVDRGSPVVTMLALDDLNVPINPPLPNIISSDVSKITATVLEPAGGSGIDFGKVSTATFVLTDPNGAVVDGNFTNNGSNKIMFTFPILSVPGTYSVSLTVNDMAGNIGRTASPSLFILDKQGPDQVRVDPGNKTVCNFTHPPLEQDQVWVYIDDSPPINYASNSSKIEVTYNGLLAGIRGAASNTALIWDLWEAATTARDQTQDGRYDVYVEPVDDLGNKGTTYKSSFTLDSQAPAMIKTDPASGTIFGLGTRTISAKFSDAPRDLVTYMGAGIAGDPGWHAGNGSGLNPTNGSFTLSADIGVAISAAPTLSTDTLSFPFTDSTFSGPASAGIMEIQVIASMPDRVTQRIPNVRVETYPITYDFLRPNFVFTKPKAGKKYCKMQLDMEGYMHDRGSHAKAMVKSGEISADKSAWAPVTAAALPSASSSWTVTADISTQTDGDRTIYGRSTDQGGNESHPSNGGAATPEPTEITIKIDRTPPVPPTLILPLNDTLVSTRGALFRWSKVTDGSRYLFQVSDTQAFTNILNRAAVASDPGLIGYVTPGNEGTFSAPKDGTYYWRVAAIEDCEDGYNISSFSATWKYTVDSVKPRVLEVQPSPSTGNKVTTGMVTFTIRFSENMNTTKPPTVSLTSAGGQYMLVEQLKYRDNTWTGTTVIPKNNSALYDGNAVIAISAGRDLAGNEMEIDSTNQIIINTGPAFDTKIFSNPAHEYEIVIVTRATEALQGPPVCSISQGGGRVPVTMNFLKERFYAGSYRIDPAITGKAYIDISGTDLYGMTGRGSVEFTVAALNPSVRTYITTFDKTSTLDFPAGSVAKATALFVVPRALVEKTASSTAPNARVSLNYQGRNLSANTVPTAELKEIMMLDEIGPASTKFARKVWYRTSIKELKTDVPAAKVHVYRQVGDTWAFCGGVVKDEQITAQIDGVGKLALMADVKPPNLLRVSPTDQDMLDDPLPTFEGSFADGGSGIWSESLTFSIDGVPQTGVALDAGGNFAFTPKKPLVRGPHKVDVSVSDRAGNVISKSFTVIAPGPFAIDELTAFPNPSRGEAIYINYNLQQKADEIKLKIMDTSGAKVATFDTSDFNALSSGKLKWDLRNDDGDKVANGVYYFKMEATKNGKKHKTTRKLAVLR
jgi:hypothetical protein